MAKQPLSFIFFNRIALISFFLSNADIKLAYIPGYLVEKSTKVNWSQSGLPLMCSGIGTCG